MTNPRSLLDIEEDIVALSDRLADLVTEYDTTSAAAARAEADYRLAYHSTFLRLKGQTVSRVTDKEADARATVACADEFRAYKITAASVDAARMAILTHRTRLEALRTLAASTRAMTVGA